VVFVFFTPSPRRSSLFLPAAANSVVARELNEWELLFHNSPAAPPAAAKYIQSADSAFSDSFATHVASFTFYLTLCFSRVLWILLLNMS